MRNVWTIFKREFWAYFNSPIAYIFIVLFLVFMSILFFFVGHFYIQERADMRFFFMILPYVYVLFVAAITMRLWSEERKTGTVEILLTLPVHVREIVLGKFLAGLVILALSLVLTFGIPLTVAWMGDPDWGPIFSGYIGALFLGATFLAMGAFFSAVTENQIIALVLTTVVGIVLCFLGNEGVVAEMENLLPFNLGEFLSIFGVTSRFENAGRGVLALEDLVFYLSLIVFFLFLNNYAVETKKY